jgi:hypothetical protein
MPHLSSPEESVSTASHSALPIGPVYKQKYVCGLCLIITVVSFIALIKSSLHKIYVYIYIYTISDLFQCFEFVFSYQTQFTVYGAFCGEVIKPAMQNTPYVVVNLVR